MANNYVSTIKNGRMFKILRRMKWEHSGRKRYLRLTKNNHKNVTSKRAIFTKPEREYVKGIVHNLSFQRLTDREIVQWLHDEKEVDQI